MLDALSFNKSKQLAWVLPYKVTHSNITFIRLLNNLSVVCKARAGSLSGVPSCIGFGQICVVIQVWFFHGDTLFLGVRPRAHGSLEENKVKHRIGFFEALTVSASYYGCFQKVQVPITCQCKLTRAHVNRQTVAKAMANTKISVTLQFSPTNDVQKSLQLSLRHSCKECV